MRMKKRNPHTRQTRSKQPSSPLFILMLVFVGLLLFCVAAISDGRSFERNIAYAEVVPVEVDGHEMPTDNAASAPSVRDNPEYRVQAVLSAKRHAVIASPLDAKIVKFNVSNGEIFKKGAVLVEYDCSVDRARLKEMESRQRVTQAQLDAYTKLKDMGSVAEVEYIIAKENNEQNLALSDQIRGRLALCRIIAPYDGRVTNKMASQFEFVQTGRVLLDITSREALRAEFLIPSKWLRWLNTGTPLQIYIAESDRYYSAKIVAVHGEVDPVSQSVQVVAEMQEYHEELLPGMSGHATFDPSYARQQNNKGFLGLVLNVDEQNGHGANQIK